MASDEEMQVVVFRAGESDYCADIRDVREIIRLDNITSIPGSGEHLEGIINVRGEIVPLISLRSLTGMPRQETDRETRVLIIDHKPAFGLIVDTVGEVKKVPRETVVPLPPMIRNRIDNHLFTGIVKLPDRILIIIDLKKVVDRKAPEQECLAIDTEPAGVEETLQVSDNSDQALAPATPALTAVAAPEATQQQPQPDLTRAPPDGVSDNVSKADGGVTPARAAVPAEQTIEVHVTDPRITEIHLDALREIGNIGTSHAATSLSTLVNIPINITVPDIKLVQISNISGMMSETMMVGLLLELKNAEASVGYLYNLFPAPSALRIVDKLMGLEIGTTKELDEMGQSAIMEVGNIISSSFCDAVAEFLGITMLPTPPSYVCDMADSILENTIVEISMIADDAIIFRTDMADDEHIFEGYVMLFLNPETLEKILSIIDSKLGL
ncbi:chemotaxis protein CheW [Methanocella arvoryzae]|uniref:Predicted chemotaxis protein (CheW/CheC-like) n=1 Tax=Methanocella arvoryzae (strain DSM 22066 / NBRC 105507 / MRE50) TaxID=351160 RepID=Q0W1T8_METAR|nr:chemotaxis protein CheW [Methanocella arvoryzae]CAJ37655.1 predicted chemotaxis protein (CheW/CheC-like) [Methanocella arvoryzae MRE50]